MNESQETENIYTLLPRFVTAVEEDTNYIDGKYLPTLVRSFVWNGLDFKFIISPARIRDQQGSDRYYYPRQRERLVEASLRRLAEEITDFDSEELALGFRLTELVNEIGSLSPDFEPDTGDAEMGLRILADVKYELINGESEFYFRPLERLTIREKNGRIFCTVQFSEFFFKRTAAFDLCFSPGNSSKLKA